ncbi:MAG: T9SS type A sorting domain-containing protein, partial [Bacteroidetes bacterium]|nr:T9SS type A sorting domain-containing protein [Bacteroidota bacterium]
DSLLWFTNYDNNQIGQYNISTESLTVFDYTKLPVSDKFRVRNYFVVLDSNTGSNNIVFFISENYEPKLLIYNSITKDWKVEEMGIPANSLIYSNQDDSFCSFLWPFNNNEIAVSFNNKNVRSFCIYNRVTKQWRDFEVPIDFFHDENGNLIAKNFRSLLFPKKIDWIEKNKSIGILYDSYLIEYTPSSSTDDISTEEGIFQEIGIRSVYPNPIKRSSQVDIMCYVQDLSKIDIGLYDVLGTKILDLNNNYEYNSTTHTITTTIEVPVGTPSGTYYLNVRNGSERRTRVVAIGR